jgi:hypothetical protein
MILLDQVGTEHDHNSMKTSQTQQTNQTFLEENEIQSTKTPSSITLNVQEECK